MMRRTVYKRYYFGDSYITDKADLQQNSFLKYEYMGNLFKSKHSRFFSYIITENVCNNPFKYCVSLLFGHINKFYNTRW